MSVYDGNKYDGWNEYVLYGGLPPVVLLRTAEQKIELLKSLFQETYINDIISRHSVKHRDEFEELINILASAIGSLTNPKKLTDTFKSKKNKVISSNTIKSYLDYLCDAYVVSRATRYDIKGKKYIDTPQKYYFSDVGIRNACIKRNGISTRNNAVIRAVKIAACIGYVFKKLHAYAFASGSYVQTVFFAAKRLVRVK